MFRDLRRICDEPTKEDREWFPDFAGAPWREVLTHAMRDYKDESFILQFLSPRVMRELRLFGIVDDDAQNEYEVAAIHDASGYRRVRELLASQYNLGDREPNIQIVKADVRGDRSLTLRHSQHQRRPLHESADAVMRHMHRLWGFPVRLESISAGEVTSTRTCP
jgi:spore cortex formation protein SpoVR/YcgB (stage V sporulation)